LNLRDRNNIHNGISLLFYLPNVSSYRDRTDLIINISKFTLKTTLVVSNYDINIKYYSNFQIIEVPHGIRFPGSTTLRASWFVWQLLNKNEYNIIHDTFARLFPLFIFKKLFKTTKFVTSLYILSEWDFKNYFWPRYKYKNIYFSDLRSVLVRIFTQRIICNLADYVILQAPGLIDRLVDASKIYKKKIVWLQNNVSNLRISNAIHPSNKKIKLLFIGPLSHGKGGDIILGILEQAHLQNINISIRIIGGIARTDQLFYKHRIKKFISNKSLEINSKVNYEKVINNIDKSDFIIHFSQVDGSPRAVLESMARGKIVFTLKHPGVIVLDKDQQLLKYCDGLSHEEILKLIVNTKENMKLSHNKKISAHINRNFTSEVIAKKYIKFYKSII
jgi:glycosyltransferase involved in cell wall biosynthesis